MKISFIFACIGTVAHILLRILEVELTGKISNTGHMFFWGIYAAVIGIIWVISTEDVPEGGCWIEYPSRDLKVGDEIETSQFITHEGETRQGLRLAFIYKVKDDLIYIIQHGDYYPNPDNHGNAELN